MGKSAAILMMVISTTTAGCTNYTTVDSPKVCDAWSTIHPSRKDKFTPPTAEQVVGNNVAREAWCTPPPKFASLRSRS